MRNSKWINEFISEIQSRKLILLYGNVYDHYYYENNLLGLDEVMEEIGEVNILEDYYTENKMSEIANLLKGNQSVNHTTTGYRDEHGVLNVDCVREELTNNTQLGQKNVIYIKNAGLFFSDYDSNSEVENIHSVHYFNEFLRKSRSENILIVLVSEKLQYFPPAIYKDNPEAAVIQIEYPESEIREEFIKEYLSYDDVNDYYGTLNDFAKMTSSRTLKEVEKIFIKGQEQGLDYSKPEEFISYYDFGEEESPWTKLNIEDVRNMDQTLKDRVLGQDHAVEFVKKILVRAKLGLTTVHQSNYSTRPIGLFFFVGPTGVGKTELAKALTDAVFKSESEFKRFDMSEYKEESSLNKLIGSSPGYVGYEEGGQLTNWVREHPFSVILFDEIEKADPKIWDTFLQILEDGRLTDNKGKTVHFNESIIIFTSNIGNKRVNSHLEANPEVEQEVLQEMYLDAVRNYFKNDLGRVEILNRIGNNIIAFNHIENREIYQKITKAKLDVIVDNIEQELDCSLVYDDDVIDFIIDRIKAKDDKFGARAVINFLETYFVNEFGVFYIQRQPQKTRAVVTKEPEAKITFKGV